MYAHIRCGIFTIRRVGSKYDDDVTTTVVMSVCACAFSLTAISTVYTLWHTHYRASGSPVAAIGACAADE